MDISWNEYYLQVTERIRKVLGKEWKASEEEMTYLAYWYNEDVSVEDSVTIFFDVFCSDPETD